MKKSHRSNGLACPCHVACLVIIVINFLPILYELRLFAKGVEAVYDKAYLQGRCPLICRVQENAAQDEDPAPEVGFFKTFFGLD